MFTTFNLFINGEDMGRITPADFGAFMVRYCLVANVTHASADRYASDLENTGHYARNVGTVAIRVEGR